jgi:uncharacterized protein (TIGR04255 family)
MGERRVKYRNPPITEALVELAFDEPSPDPAVGGRFFEGWKDRCVKREPIQTQQIFIQMGPMAGIQPPPAPLVPTERLWLSSAPAFAVQVGPGLLSAHFVREPAAQVGIASQPYPGFEWFVPKVREATEHYRNLTRPTGLKHISMRYINRLQIPIQQDGSAEEWLTVGVTLPPGLDSTIGRLQVDVAMALDAVGSDLQFVLRAEPIASKHLDVWLDLKVTSQVGKAPRLDALDPWLKAAHDEGIIKTFEGSITDQARNSFEVINAAA